MFDLFFFFDGPLLLLILCFRHGISFFNLSLSITLSTVDCERLPAVIFIRYRLLLAATAFTHA